MIKKGIFSKKERILSICIKYIQKDKVSGPFFRYVIAEKKRPWKENGTSHFYLGNFS